MPKKKNVVFILTDDQRFDTINRIHGGQIRTPNLDKLTKEGVTFTKASIMGGNNPAVCCPSRNMILTGRTLFETGENGHFVPKDVKTMPQVFLENGYDCYHIGKWHQDLETHKRSFNNGKCMRVGSVDQEKITGKRLLNHFATVVHDYNDKGLYDETNYNFYGTPFISMGTSPRYSEEIHSSTVFTDAAIEILDEHDMDKPYFMFLAYVAPHDPRQYPKEYFEMFKDVEIELPKNYMDLHPFDNGEIYVRDELIAGHPRLPWSIKEHLRDYYSIITHLDYEIGRLIETLKEKNQWDDTIIVFAGDNGLAVGQHGLMGKQNMYDHSIRVPLIMAGPGIPKDKISKSKCYLLDVFPTLCDMLELKQPETVTGKSFAEVFEDIDFELREETYHAYKYWQRSLRRDKYKLILYHVDDNWTVQLFDIINDKEEIYNLAYEEEYFEIRNNMLRDIKKASIEYKDCTEQGKEFWDGFEELINNESFLKPQKFYCVSGALINK